MFRRKRGRPGGRTGLEARRIGGRLDRSAPASCAMMAVDGIPDIWAPAATPAFAPLSLQAAVKTPRFRRSREAIVRLRRDLFAGARDLEGPEEAYRKRNARPRGAGTGSGSRRSPAPTSAGERGSGRRGLRGMTGRLGASSMRPMVIGMIYKHAPQCAIDAAAWPSIDPASLIHLRRQRRRSDFGDHRHAGFALIHGPSWTSLTVDILRQEVARR